MSSERSIDRLRIGLLSLCLVARRYACLLARHQQRSLPPGTQLIVRVPVKAAPFRLLFSCPNNRGIGNDHSNSIVYLCNRNNIFTAQILTTRIVVIISKRGQLKLGVGQAPGGAAVHTTGQPGSIRLHPLTDKCPCMRPPMFLVHSFRFLLRLSVVLMKMACFWTGEWKSVQY